MSVVVVATVYPVEGMRDEVVAAFEVAAASAHGEDGNELYAIHTGKDRVVLIEKYVDMDALVAHGGTPALADLVTALDGKVVGEMDVQVLRPSPTGGPKGSL